MRRKAAVKAEVLQMVERLPLPVRQTLKELKMSSATYYRWRRRYAVRGLEGLQDLLPKARRVWNRLRDEERGFIVAYALEHPSLSPREVAARLVDREGRFVSESTAYRVLDDYSRTVLAWRVQPSMGSACIIEVVQDAVEFTGLPTVPVEPGPTLLTDNGPGFLSRAIEEFLKVRAMKHIVASPYHPQTNGKLERYHRRASACLSCHLTPPSSMGMWSGPHRTHTEEFYEVYGGELETTALNQALLAWESTYNTFRPHQALDWRTPAEYLGLCHPEVAQLPQLSHM